MKELDDYIPKKAGATLGSKGVQVKRLQNYLKQYGYMISETLDDFGVRKGMAEPAPDTEGVFDDQTKRALERFQTYHSLKATGELDNATLDLMKKPRCGFPDTAEFVVQGNKWNTTNLRYGFVNFTSDLSQSEIRAAIGAALGYWAAVTPLTFTEVPNSADPEIRIRFVTGDHGDGSAFDGPGGVLAHAFYPPPNGGDIAGDTHFDDAETWTVNLPPSGIDLYTVAAHEFGHALGLAHSTVNDALMYPYYGGPHRFLSQDDIDGIQAIYGAEGWHNNKTVLRTFVSSDSQNAWAYIEDLGWRKIEPKAPDGVTDMFLSFCKARAKGIKVNVYADASTVSIMYL